MSRHLVIVSVVGVLAIVTIQQFADGDTEVPPEPTFPTVDITQSSSNWSQDDWSVSRSIDDPFEPSLERVDSTDAISPPATIAPPGEASTPPDRGND